MFIKKSDIYTDSGIIFESKILDTSYSYDTSDYDDSDPLVETLMDFYIFVANHTPIIHRKYLKVQTILANLGGLYKALFMANYILTYYFTQIKMNQTLMNKLFNFNDDIQNVKQSQIHFNKSETKISQNNYVIIEGSESVHK